MCAQLIRYEGMILASEAPELAKFREGVYVRMKDLAWYWADQQVREERGKNRRPIQKRAAGFSIAEMTNLERDYAQTQVQESPRYCDSA